MLMTVHPCADAERWENERERRDEILQEAERKATLIVMAALQGITRPRDWCKNTLHAGHHWSAEEILAEAMERDDDTMNAYLELMISPQAKALQQAMAAWFGREYTEDLVPMPEGDDEAC